MDFGAQEIYSTRVLKVYSYNHFHNNWRLFDVLPNFPSTTSETKHDYHYY